MFILIRSLQIDTPETRFLELARKVSVDVVLCAHSHQYFIKKVQNTWFINPGSVGRPFDLDNRASYVVLEINDNDLITNNYRIAYDIEKVVEKMKKEKFPPVLCQSIALGKSLDQIREDNKKGEQN